MKTGVLHARIAEVVEQLHAVDPQHHRQVTGAVSPARLGLVHGECGLLVAVRVSGRPSVPGKARGGSCGPCPDIPEPALGHDRGSANVGWSTRSSSHNFHITGVSMSQPGRVVQSFPSSGARSYMRAHAGGSQAEADGGGEAS